MWNWSSFHGDVSGVFKLSPDLFRIGSTHSLPLSHAGIFSRTCSEGGPTDCWTYAALCHSPPVWPLRITWEESTEFGGVAARADVEWAGGFVEFGAVAFVTERRQVGWFWLRR